VSADPYSPLVRELFADPRHAGCIDGGGRVRLEDQDVKICLCADADGGVLRTLRFRAWGCPHLIAACEAFCTDHEGCEIDALLEFTAGDLMQRLSVPVEKTGRILVLEDAVRALGKSLRGSLKQN
jgi:NifU-like protein involved in Fe-S cluster formation